MLHDQVDNHLRFALVIPAPSAVIHAVRYVDELHTKASINARR